MNYLEDTRKLTRCSQCGIPVKGKTPTYSIPDCQECCECCGCEHGGDWIMACAHTDGVILADMSGVVEPLMGKFPLTVIMNHIIPKRRADR